MRLPWRITVPIPFAIAKISRRFTLPPNIMSITDDLTRLALQEQELQLPLFNETVAWQIGLHLRELALARQLGVVIDVRRIGQPLFYCALPGTTPDHAEWVRRKSNVVARFHRSSYRVKLELEENNTSLPDKFGLPATDYASHGGAFPLHVPAAGVVGSVTVSGLPQRADHELVVAALCAHLGKNYADLALA
jgi:uncharacterized protein (UPF0303 family)